MLKLLISAKEDRKQELLNTYLDAFLKRIYHFWMKKTVDGKDRGTPGCAAGVALFSIVYYDRGNWPREEAWTEDINTAKTSGRQPVEQVYQKLRTCAESGWGLLCPLAGRW